MAKYGLRTSPSAVEAAWRRAERLYRQFAAEEVASALRHRW
jgi:hypothetical protein